MFCTFGIFNPESLLSIPPLHAALIDSIVEHQLPIQIMFKVAQNTTCMNNESIRSKVIESIKMTHQTHHLDEWTKIITAGQSLKDDEELYSALESARESIS